MGLNVTLCITKNEEDGGFACVGDLARVIWKEALVVHYINLIRVILIAIWFIV